MPGSGIQIEYTVQMWREGGQYIAHAMPLDVMSAGATAEEARNALDEAVRLFMKTAAAIGTVAEVLEEAGYVWREGRWVSPSFVGVEQHTLSVAS